MSGMASWIKNFFFLLLRLKLDSNEDDGFACRIVEPGDCWAGGNDFRRSSLTLWITVGSAQQSLDCTIQFEIYRRPFFSYFTLYIYIEIHRWCKSTRRLIISTTPQSKNIRSKYFKTAGFYTWNLHRMPPSFVSTQISNREFISQKKRWNLLLLFLQKKILSLLKKKNNKKQ